MSRQIDITDPSELSDDDLRYLRDRDREDVRAQLDYLSRAEAVKAHIPANQRIIEDNDRLRNIAPLIAQERTKVDKKPARDDFHNADLVNDQTEIIEGDSYANWTNDELREELKARDLPTSGNKDELITRLEQNDRELDEDNTPDEINES